MEWPLNRFDALLIAQTYAGRPMTTHHTIELDRPLALDRWAGALRQLVDDYPELGSRVVGPCEYERTGPPPAVAGVNTQSGLAGLACAIGPGDMPGPADFSHHRVA